MYRQLVSSCHHRQSPINIHFTEVICDPKHCKPNAMKIHYHKGDCTELVVGKNSCMVKAREGCRTTLTAAHLPSTYILAQFHVHWGSNSTCGSEHTIEGQAYPAEAHFVFWNKVYESFENATHYPDGIAVVAVFLKEGSHNKDWDHVTSKIKNALEAPIQVDHEIDITKLIPLGSDLFHYDGSLTTPPYSECVLWTILMQPVEISENQLAQFRLICGDNHRDCQEYHPTVFSSKIL